MIDPKEQPPLLPWTLSFLRPYRARVALLTVLLLAEIVLGALQPWPLKIVIDYVLTPDRRPIPEPFAHWLMALGGSNNNTGSAAPLACQQDRLFAPKSVAAGTRLAFRASTSTTLFSTIASSTNLFSQAATLGSLTISGVSTYTGLTTFTS